MSHRDVYGDMDTPLLPDDGALDRVLEDRGQPEDALLALFVEDLRETFPEVTVARDVQERHLATIVVAAAEGASQGRPSAAPSRSVLQRVRSSIAARVAALTAAGLASVTGAAYAGVLPAPLQAVASDLAEFFGVDLPHPEEQDRDIRHQGQPAHEAEPGFRSNVDDPLPPKGSDAAAASSSDHTSRRFQEGRGGSEDEPEAGGNPGSETERPEAEDDLETSEADEPDEDDGPDSEGDPPDEVDDEAEPEDSDGGSDDDLDPGDEREDEAATESETPDGEADSSNVEPDSGLSD